VACPDAVEMPWFDAIGALLIAFYPGQGGGRAIAELLCGLQNPSGKSTVSFPERKEDIASFHTYPGENGRHFYAEGHFVGYRYYDLRKMDVPVPFGHGLSYTRFDYDDLRISERYVDQGTVPTVSCRVRNGGALAGKEVVQLYIRPIEPGLSRPVRELKGFTKVSLRLNETTVVTFTPKLRDFQYWDPELQRWVLRSEGFCLEIGSSSRDIRLTEKIACRSDQGSFVRVAFDTQPAVIFAQERRREIVADFVMAQMNVTRAEAYRVLGMCEDSFLGLADTLNWFFGNTISPEQISALLDTLNEGAVTERDQSAKPYS